MRERARLIEEFARVRFGFDELPRLRIGLEIPRLRLGLV
jgi:hypothetical protein